MGSGRSHFQEQHLVELQADAAGVVVDVVVADAGVVVDAVVAAVAEAVGVAVDGPGRQLQADGMPDKCSSTTGCIVLHSSFDFRILDIDSYYHLIF